MGKNTGGPTTAVIDLEAIAKATGQEAVLEQQMATAREELNNQLTVVIAELEKQLAEEQAKLGDSPDQAEQQRFQQITAQAQQQLAQQRTQAQQQIQRYQAGLIADFRDTVKPISAEIATSRGADVILIFDPMMLWFEPSIDITDEVIGVLRDRNIEFPTNEGILVGAAPAAEVEPVVEPAAE
jgi:Skp family chaperone for outer membrane proteins